MNQSGLTMAQQMAIAICDFQHQQTGHAPRSVKVVFSDGTLVVTLHDALTPAEKALSRTPEGAAQVREFHRELFRNSLGPLRGEIERITGVAVGEAVSEVEAEAGAVMGVFTSGTMVQVFQLDGLSAETWDGTGPPGGP